MALGDVDQSSVKQKGRKLGQVRPSQGIASAYLDVLVNLGVVEDQKEEGNDAQGQQPGTVVVVEVIVKVHPQLGDHQVRHRFVPLRFLEVSKSWGIMKALPKASLCLTLLKKLPYLMSASKNLGILKRMETRVTGTTYLDTRFRLAYSSFMA